MTEETLVRHTAEIASAIASLRERGVRFAVDDVGAGYSGLGQLATLRPTLLARPAPPWPGIDEQALRHPPVLLAG